MKDKLRLTFIFTEEDDGFVGICEELNIASEGDTFVEVKENLEDAVKLYLIHAIETNRFNELVPRPAPKYVINNYMKQNSTTKNTIQNVWDYFKDLGQAAFSDLLHL